MYIRKCAIIEMYCYKEMPMYLLGFIFKVCYILNHTITEMNCVVNRFLNGKCPKTSYTKVSDKIAYANSVDPDQIAPQAV